MLTLGTLYNGMALFLSVATPIYYAIMATNPKMFIFDFDGTITAKDTISVIAHSAIVFQAQNGGTDMAPAWECIVKAYGQDYEEFVRLYEPRKEDRKTVEEEVEFYRALKGVEGRSFERVSSSGLFKGIGDDDWRRMGREAVERGDVRIRKGFAEFLGRVEKEGGVWGIVSINFSSSFIKGVLGMLGIDVEDVKVLANHPDENGIVRGPRREDGTGREVITTSDGKLAAMKELRKAFGVELKTNEVVYFGDSGTDLECLLDEGTTGILVTDDGESSLMQITRRIGVEIHPVEGHPAKESYWWIRDFHQAAALF